jgi:hypothetical protein
MHRLLERIRRGHCASLLALAAATAGCASNPATGKSRLDFYSEALEIEMGRQADREISAQMGVVDDPALQSHVSEFGLRLAAKSERPHLPWTFKVMDDAAVNAFALPGGFIYVTRGILGHLSSEAVAGGPARATSPRAVCGSESSAGTSATRRRDHRHRSAAAACLPRVLLPLKIHLDGDDELAVRFRVPLRPIEIDNPEVDAPRSSNGAILDVREREIENHGLQLVYRWAAVDVSGVQ